MEITCLLRGFVDSEGRYQEELKGNYVVKDDQGDYTVKRFDRNAPFYQDFKTRAIMRLEKGLEGKVAKSQEVELPLLASFFYWLSQKVEGV